MTGNLGILHSFWKEDRGQDLVEYALIAMMVMLAAVTAVAGLGSAIVNRYKDIADAF